MVRRRRVLVVLAGAAAVWGAGPLAVPGAAGARAVPAVRGAAVPAASSRGRAIEVPGLGALNRGGDAGVNSVSCAPAGNCAAGGYYQNHGLQGFVAVERHGRWGRATGVPGLGALNRGGDAVVSSVSCAPAGNCAAGGTYTDGGRHQQGFVAVGKNGRWSRATGVPGLAALNKGGNARLYVVSCASAGGCAAGGSYRNRSGHRQAFVASENNGRWEMATEVPGIAALNAGHHAEVLSVSCAPASGCAAGGVYTDSSGNNQGFVAVEQNGRWGKAIEVPGLGALNKGGGSENAGGGAEVDSVSCAPAGNCAAGGNYADGDGNVQGFVVNERNGRWGKAIEVPGLGPLNDSGDAEVYSVSCPSAATCLAGGDYDYAYDWGFAAVERNGVWGRATDAPGLDALASGRDADVNSVSCASPGNCAVGGDYEVMESDDYQGFIVSERNGRWSRAINAPAKALNKGGEAAAVSVSCGSAGNCAAGGYYTDSRGNQQGFVT